MTFESDTSSKANMSEAHLQQMNSQEATLSRLPEKPKIIVETNDLTIIRSFYKRIPLTIAEPLFEKYSKLIDLLDVKIQGMALIASVNFWDPFLQCMMLTDIGLSPTLEEYAHFLDMPLTPKGPVYVPNRHKVSLAKVAVLFGVNESNLLKGRMDKRGIHVWPMEFIKNCMEVFVKHNRWSELKDLIIASVYGLILFPNCKDSVSHEALDVYFQVVNNGANPVPAILADTLLTLNHGRKNGRSKLKCCLQLLYVWLICHVKGNELDCLKTYSKASKILKHFKNEVMKNQDRQFWLNELGRVSEKTVKWHIPWVAGSGILTGCGKFPYVPLIGTTGYVAYTPLLVL